MARVDQRHCPLSAGEVLMSRELSMILVLVVISAVLAILLLAANQWM